MAMDAERLAKSMRASLYDIWYENKDAVLPGGRENTADDLGLLMQAISKAIVEHITKDAVVDTDNNKIK